MTDGVETDAELGEDALRNLVEEYKALVRDVTGPVTSRMDPRRPALGRDRGGVEVVDAQEGRRLPHA